MTALPLPDPVEQPPSSSERSPPGESGSDSVYGCTRNRYENVTASSRVFGIVQELEQRAQALLQRGDPAGDEVHWTTSLSQAGSHGRVLDTGFGRPL